MNDADLPAYLWWSNRRWRYNIGMATAGVLAFLVSAVIGSTLLPEAFDFEVTMLTSAIQTVFYLAMMGVANICYLLGPLAEQVCEPEEPEKFRETCFRLGYLFSVLLPFMVPAIMIVVCLRGIPPPYISLS